MRMVSPIIGYIFQLKSRLDFIDKSVFLQIDKNRYTIAEFHFRFKAACLGFDNMIGIKPYTIFLSRGFIWKKANALIWVDNDRAQIDITKYVFCTFYSSNRNDSTPVSF
ncbi:hypothetical protein RGU73_26755 [Neobacillus cucumis]|nr:hypothetical protein [Neobacillus cucumis]MDR4949885.1 hypothetical protein [Neobacillus cucumis]